jgi:HK97 family phage prohead protease
MTATLAVVHHRSIETELELRDTGDGLTVVGLVMPYDTPVDVTHEDTGPYREVFVRGAFDRALRRPTVVSLTYRHDQSLTARRGYARSFEDTPEGLRAEFRLDPSTGPKARDVLTSTHTSFSVGFVSIVPRPGTERSGDLVVRRSVHLDHVAATDRPVYELATVAAVRSADTDDEPTVAELAASQQRRADEALRAELRALIEAQQRWISTAS